MRESQGAEEKKGLRKLNFALGLPGEPELSAEEVSEALGEWDRRLEEHREALLSPETRASKAALRRHGDWEGFEKEIIRIQPEGDININSTVTVEIDLPLYMVAAVMNGDVVIRDEIRDALVRKGKTWWRPYWGAKLAAERLMG